MKPNLRELRELTGQALELEDDWRRAADDLEDAFRCGVAGEAAALLAPGTSLARKEDTERLARQVELRAL